VKKSKCRSGGALQTELRILIGCGTFVRATTMATKRAELHAPARWMGVLGACFLLLVLQSLAALAQQSEIPALSTVASENNCPPAQQSCCCCGNCETTRPSCPPGYSIYDDYCLPDCPAGYVRYPGAPGVCIPPGHYGCPDGYEPVPLPSCPDGYHRDLRNAGTCVADLHPSAACPPGLKYSLEAGHCTPDCPRGTYVGADGLCHSYYQRECPEGYRRNPETGACMPPGDWPPTYVFICLPLCPQGLVRDPVEPTRCVPPRRSCPKGYENVRGLCLPVCERGTKRDSYGYCVPPECPPGSYADLRGKCQPVGCPEGYENIQGRCLPPCPGGLRRNPDNLRCERHNGGNQPCPEGTVLNERTGACEPKVRVPSECPTGFIRLPSGECVRPGTMVPRQPACAPGEEYNPRTKRCTPIRLVPRACPRGMVYDARLRRCIRIQVPSLRPLAPLPRPKPRILNLRRGCPRGMVLDRNGRCRRVK